MGVDGRLPCVVYLHCNRCVVSHIIVYTHTHSIGIYSLYHNLPVRLPCVVHLHCNRCIVSHIVVYTHSIGIYICTLT